MAGQACLVFEVSGLGPWDTVTGIYSNYAAAATSLNLTLGAPSAQAFLVAAACGDSTVAGQALAPAGWTALAAVSGSNGTDHTCDAVLTTAVKTTSGSVSVSATASSATDLSGVIIGVLAGAASPIPGGGNPGWAGRTILEAAFGSGFQTPEDQRTWTALNDSSLTPAQQAKRFWSMRDSGGVPYALGQLQSTSGAYQLDNSDGAFSPSNSGGPYYPHVTTGTPLRLRVALGTLADGTVVNRWYVISRNSLAWPEKRNKALRGYVEATTTDIWSVAGASCPSAYRGEVEQDGPGWWWTADDQPLAGGVLPTSLRNAAAGSGTVLNIIASPAGVGAGDGYATSGTDATATYPVNTSVPPPSVAVYACGALQGWGYGDPQSSQQSYQTGNPVTSSPGSAAWQVSGMQGAGGSNGWFAAARDAAYPPLSGGVHVKGWFNAAFYASATGWHDISGGGYYSILGQPYSTITLAALTTDTAPVALLQLDRATGHLQLVTYSSGTPTTTALYTASDLRCSSFTAVDLSLTQTTVTAYVNGGLSAQVTATVPSMTSAWTWLTLNGDYGTSGGNSPASVQHGGNVAYSHWAVFTGTLPAWRVLAHYCAMVTGFGVLPAPQSMSLSTVQNKLGTGWTPDGTAYQGSYGHPGGTTVTTFVFSALAAAVAGAYTSGPSARAITAGQGVDDGGTFYGPAIFASFAALAPSVRVYTAAAAAAETEASAVCGSGDAYTAGYGSSATGTGACHVSGGTGASPPSAPSGLGDTVAQRIERVLGYARVTYPLRGIDADAAALVQAALDVGGQQGGASVQAIVDSDNGWLYLGTDGALRYRSRPHLAADTVTWHVGMNVIAGMRPFDDSIEWSSDPQRIWDVITVQPYSPDGASLASLTPSDAAAADAAQEQFGPRAKPVTSYLQSATSQQAQADWLLSAFGVLRRRASVVAINAATHPAAWELFMAANITDIVQVYDAPFGSPSTTGNYRISQLSRSLAFGANGQAAEAKMVMVLDPVITPWS
jgi:hypothetical protein